jgi:hypothetical protein
MEATACYHGIDINSSDSTVGYLKKRHCRLVAIDMEISCQTHQNRRRSKDSGPVLTLTVVQGESL